MALRVFLPHIPLILELSTAAFKSNSKEIPLNPQKKATLVSCDKFSVVHFVHVCVFLSLPYYPVSKLKETDSRKERRGIAGTRKGGI